VVKVGGGSRDQNPMARLTNAGSLFGKNCGTYPQNQNERLNDRVLFKCCQLLKIENASRPDKDILYKGSQRSEGRMDEPLVLS